MTRSELQTSRSKQRYDGEEEGQRGARRVYEGRQMYDGGCGSEQPVESSESAERNRSDTYLVFGWPVDGSHTQRGWGRKINTEHPSFLDGRQH